MGRRKTRGAAAVHLRWMIRRDLPEVLEIERGGFDFPWVEEEFIGVLRIQTTIAFVAEVSMAFVEEASASTFATPIFPKVVGFMIYDVHRKTLHVLNFAVHPDWRGRGIGAQMVAKLTSKLSSHRRTNIALDVRETNLDAQLFFRRMGFRAVGVRRNFYADSGEDSFRMVYRADEDSFASRIEEF